LKHKLVQRQIGNQGFEPLVLFLQLPQTMEFGYSHAGKLFLPAIKGDFSDADFATELPPSTARKVATICS